MVSETTDPCIVKIGVSYFSFMSHPRVIVAWRNTRVPRQIVWAAERDDAGEDIQGGEQVRGAVADVVMRTLLGLPEGDRQQRLRPVQGLDLRLLVERQHHRTRRRVQVQAHDVGDLRREVRRVAGG